MVRSCHRLLMNKSFRRHGYDLLSISRTVHARWRAIPGPRTCFAKACPYYERAVVAHHRRRARRTAKAFSIPLNPPSERHSADFLPRGARSVRQNWSFMRRRVHSSRLWMDVSTADAYTYSSNFSLSIEVARPTFSQRERGPQSPAPAEFPRPSLS